MCWSREVGLKVLCITKVSELAFSPFFKIVFFFFLIERVLLQGWGDGLVSKVPAMQHEDLSVDL